MHVSTGNYHTRTSKLYTDFGLLTADTTVLTTGLALLETRGVRYGRAEIATGQGVWPLVHDLAWALGRQLGDPPAMGLDRAHAGAKIVEQGAPLLGGDPARDLVGQPEHESAGSGGHQEVSRTIAASKGG